MKFVGNTILAVELRTISQMSLKDKNMTFHPVQITQVLNIQGKVWLIN